MTIDANDTLWGYIKRTYPIIRLTRRVYLVRIDREKKFSRWRIVREKG